MTRDVIVALTLIGAAVAVGLFFGNKSSVPIVPADKPKVEVWSESKNPHPSCMIDCTKLCMDMYGTDWNSCSPLEDHATECNCK